MNYYIKWIQTVSDTWPWEKNMVLALSHKSSFQVYTKSFKDLCKDIYEHRVQCYQSNYDKTNLITVKYELSYMSHLVSFLG